MPLRRRQHHRLHLPLSRLELRHRRRAGRRAVFPRGLPFRARQARNGASSRSRSSASTRARCGPIGMPAAPPFLEYLGEFRRFLDLILDGWDGREGQAELLGGVQKWLIPCNWKFPGREFQRRHLSQHLAPLGRSGRRRPERAQPARLRRTATWPASCTSRSPIAGIRRSPTCCRGITSRRPAYQNSPEVAEYFRHCEEERRQAPRRRRPADRRARRDLPQCGAAAAPAAHAGGVAPEERAPDRGVALLLRRPRRAAGGEELPARLLHPLLRARPG